MMLPLHFLRVAHLMAPGTLSVSRKIIGPPVGAMDRFFAVREGFGLSAIPKNNAPVHINFLFPVTWVKMYKRYDGSPQRISKYSLEMVHLTL